MSLGKVSPLLIRSLPLLTLTGLLVWFEWFEDGHYLLYAAMVLMPLTGYIGTGVNTEYFLMFDIPKFESTELFNLLVIDGLGMTFEAFEKPIDNFHKIIMGEYVLLMLIFGHVAAALYHHIILKDRTLKKMTADIVNKI